MTTKCPFCKKKFSDNKQLVKLAFEVETHFKEKHGLSLDPEFDSVGIDFIFEQIENEKPKNTKK